MKNTFIILLLSLLLLTCAARHLKKNEEKTIQPDEIKMISSYTASLSQTQARQELEGIYTYSKTLDKSMPKFIENIDFLGQGYNIFYGNPHSTNGLDPGYKNFRISSLEYPVAAQDSLSSDRQYLLPNGTRVLTQQSCSISFSSKSLMSLQSYSESLSVGISVGASFGPASFSASADYQSVRSGLKSQSSVFIESGAQCIVYQAGLIDSEGYQPTPSPQFADLMRELEAAGENESQFHNVFDQIGTHVTEEIKLGSLFGYVYETSSSDFQSLQSQNFNFELSASIFSVKGSVKTSYEAEQQNKFSSILKNWKAYSIGAQPEANNDPGVWATQTLTNPMPVYAQLLSLPEYLNKYNSKNQIGLSNSSGFKDRMSKYLGTYCENRIKAIGRITTCKFEDIKAPIVQSQSQSSLSFYDKYLKGAPILLAWYNSGKPYSYDKGSNLVRLQAYRRYQAQTWIASRVGTSDSYIFKNGENYQCLSPQESNSTSRLTISVCKENYQLQQWRVIVIDEGNAIVKIQNVGTSAYLNSDNWSEEENTIGITFAETDSVRLKVSIHFAT